MVGVLVLVEVGARLGVPVPEVKPPVGLRRIISVEKGRRVAVAGDGSSVAVSSVGGAMSEPSTINVVTAGSVPK